jgi:hypothetical protein
VADVIKKLVAELDDDDFKARDAAQEKLVSMGVIVVSTLERMRAQQSPEAQQRIDAVLKQVNGKTAASSAVGN